MLPGKLRVCSAWYRIGPLCRHLVYNGLLDACTETDRFDRVREYPDDESRRTSYRGARGVQDEHNNQHHHDLPQAPKTWVVGAFPLPSPPLPRIGERRIGPLFRHFIAGGVLDSCAEVDGFDHPYEYPEDE